MSVSAHFKKIFSLVPEHYHGNVLIFSEENNSRLTYTSRFIFNHVLGLNFRITNNSEEFQNVSGTRINYSDREMVSVFKIAPSGLMWQQGLLAQRPEAFYDQGHVQFFRTEKKCDCGFDIFSAVFYFISRMEEWQTFKPDKHGRFEASESILFEKAFYLKPVVDQWIIELGFALRRYYPEMILPEKKAKLLSTIDVDNLFAFKEKGTLRTAGAIARDLMKRDIAQLKERIAVLKGRKKDPFDVYDDVTAFCEEFQIPLIYFFLLRTGTVHDRTVNPARGAFADVLKKLASSSASVGLHPSYYSVVKPALFEEEIHQLKKLIGKKVELSRQHYLRFDIRNTPKVLAGSGIQVDFTMGYAATPGFRAGTSHPFYYYDFHSEQSGELLMVPFCVMDGVYIVYKNRDPESAMNDLMNLAAEIRLSGGYFISVFHERSFSDHLYPGFGTLYKNLHLRINQLFNN